MKRLPLLKWSHIFLIATGVGILMGCWDFSGDPTNQYAYLMFAIAMGFLFATMIAEEKEKVRP
jgi:hypothetical protein